MAGLWIMCSLVYGRACEESQLLTFDFARRCIGSVPFHPGHGLGDQLTPDPEVNQLGESMTYINRKKTEFMTFSIDHALSSPGLSVVYLMVRF